MKFFGLELITILWYEDKGEKGIFWLERKKKSLPLGLSNFIFKTFSRDCCLLFLSTWPGFLASFYTT